MESRLSSGFYFYISVFLLGFTIVSSFSPIDHYLINCGSTEYTVVDGDNRRFAGDSPGPDSSLLYGTRSMSLRDWNPAPDSSPIYHTARVFTKPLKYVFRIREKGNHLVRFHFHRFNASGFDLKFAQFHVSANGYVLLHDFSGENTRDLRVMDYVIWVDTDKLAIEFTPSRKSNLAFVNAIEVISAPKDLIPDAALLVNSVKIENINGLMKNAFETVYRVNVGGSKVTPFNDSLWRTWVPDDEFLKSDFGSNPVYFSGSIRYQKGGASREVGPDNVYNSARLIKSSNSTVPGLNISWLFPVTEGYKHLVRMHFCDIASISLGLLFFNVYINGNLAYENLDLSRITNMLASPYYADVLVDDENLQKLTVTVGPSNWSMPYAIDAILNGVEIMKINNSMGSLDGEISVGLIRKSWSRGNSGVFVPFMAVICLLLIASVVMQKSRKVAPKDSVAWSRLPVVVSEAKV